MFSVGLLTRRFFNEVDLVSVSVLIFSWSCLWILHLFEPVLLGDSCTLQESLKMLVKDEKLVGDNKYMCEKCGGLQEAVRSVRLAELPEVVNLQLMRFVYDLESNRKRKLDSTVRFPHSLCLSDFCTPSFKKSSSPDSFLYDLSAVLLHLGDSAYSGHYIAHIRDERFAPPSLLPF